MVGYSDEQKGYQCYNPRTKQLRVSRHVVFDKSDSWYLPPPPIPDNSILISEDEVNEAEMPPDEEEIRALEENVIKFWLSGPNEVLTRHDQSDEEPVSNGDSVALSPCRKTSRKPMRKEKGKMKMPENGTYTVFCTRVTLKPFGAKMDLWRRGRSRPRGPSNQQSRSCVGLPARRTL